MRPPAVRVYCPGCPVQLEVTEDDEGNWLYEHPGKPCSEWENTDDRPVESKAGR